MNEPFLLLIDGSSLLSTQFFGNLPREILFAKTPEEKAKYFHKIMMTSGGVYTNAVYGFLRTLFKILKDQKPEYLAVAWDLTRDTFRRELYADYKGNRSETMEPLKDQFVLCQETLREMGVRQFMSERYEADDYCGTLAKLFENEVPVRIMTKDHDYLQLVTENTHMWLMHPSMDKTDEMYKKYHVDRKSMNVPERVFELDPALVEAEFGVKPCHVNSLKGLQGDSSDNIKGVPGVGPATAVKLIQEYGTVDALYKALEGRDKAGLEELKKYWKEKLGITRSPINFLTKTSEEELVGEKSARLSEILATIKTDIDLDGLTLAELKTDISRENTEKILKNLEFSSLSADFMSTTEAEEDYAANFAEVDGMTGLEDLLVLLKKDPALGISYEAGLGLAIARESGEARFVAEAFFVTDAVLAAFVKKLSEGRHVLYSTEGKSIVKLADVTTRDTGIMTYLLDPLRADYPYEYIVKNAVNKNFPARTLLLGKLSGEEALSTAREAVRDCLCYNALSAVLSGPTLEKQLEDQGMLKLFNDIELPCMGALARMETAGIMVRREELKAFGEELKKEIDVLEREIYDAAGMTFNINSPKQLGEVLFEHMAIPYGKKTKSGYSTAADILEKLAPEYPFVGKILEYRTLTKLRSTYAEGLQPCISADGRIHGTFNQTITATGRISSTNPNLQNIPVRIELGRKIRKVFVPRPGCVFIDADYSQIELRVLAHMSGDENLINAYRDARDIHALTASQVFHVPIDEVTSLMRRNAKAVNFGIVYGISAFALSEDLSITRKEAQEYMNRYFETYPGIEAFLKGQVDSARENGSVTTLYGRIRPIPELMSTNFNQRSFGERVAMNSPIQGTAADIMKIAMIHVEKALKDAGLRSKIVLQVHDELIVEAYEEEADAVEEILVREMENAADLSVHLDVEAKRGYSWYETK